MLVEEMHATSIFGIRDSPAGLPYWPVITLAGEWPDGKSTSSTIRLLTTNPHLGGVRYWYECPRCHRRAAKLYVADAESELACRRCWRLVYSVQHRKSPKWAYFRWMLGAKLTERSLAAAQQYVKMVNRRRGDPAAGLN